MPLRPRELTADERRELRRHEAALDRAERARRAARASFAAFVRAVGIAPAARALGTTPGGLQSRLRKIDATSPPGRPEKQARA